MVAKPCPGWLCDAQGLLLTKNSEASCGGWVWGTLGWITRLISLFLAQDTHAARFGGGRRGARRKNTWFEEDENELEERFTASAQILEYDPEAEEQQTFEAQRC